MRSILLLILFFVGAAVNAAPTEDQKRIEYTSSLNAMASIIMNWYGSLILVDEESSFSKVDAKWDDYRFRYPQNIKQIQITSTDLTKLDDSNLYQFEVNSLVQYQDESNNKSLERKERFIFHVPLLSKPIIKRVETSQSEHVQGMHTTEFDRTYYKPRQFAYQWLAYLDGVNLLPIDAEQWLHSANYSMTIGGDVLNGSITTLLEKRQKYLAQGGHLLRKLGNKKVDGKDNTYVLDLIIEWKGSNPSGKPVLAKIHQEIEYEIQKDKSWKVLSIKERHLLPDIAPWVGLLC
ncbi:MAG: hypothetical protein GQ547_08465 [Methylophaga sp.]|nr:hypothetical protein [Methylophaga sp.]